MRTSLSSPILLNPDEEITFFDDIQSEAYVSHRPVFSTFESLKVLCCSLLHGLAIVFEHHGKQFSELFTAIVGGIARRRSIRILFS